MNTTGRIGRATLAGALSIGMVWAGATGAHAATTADSAVIFESAQFEGSPALNRATPYVFTLSHPETATEAVSGVVTIAGGAGASWTSDTGCVVADEPMATPECAVEALAPGESREFRAIMTSYEPTAHGTITVESTFTEESGATATSTTETELLIGAYPVAITFSADQVTPGQDLAITMTATNDSQNEAGDAAFHFVTSEGVTLIDASGATVSPLAEALAPGFGSDVNGTVSLNEPLAPGATTSVTLNVTVDADAPDAIQAYAWFVATPGQHPDDTSDEALASVPVTIPVVETATPAPTAAATTAPTAAPATPVADGPQLAETGLADHVAEVWVALGLLVGGAALVVIARRKTARG